MRHGKARVKLGMKSQHKRAVLANMVCSLIRHNRIQTTVAKAKVASRLADRMVTLAKKGTLHHRRQALAVLRDKMAVRKLFAEIGKQNAARAGGYTRIIRVGPRLGDAAEVAILEWTQFIATEPKPANSQKGKDAKEVEPSKEGQKS